MENISLSVVEFEELDAVSLIPVSFTGTFCIFVRVPLFPMVVDGACVRAASDVYVYLNKQSWEEDTRFMTIG